MPAPTIRRTLPTQKQTNIKPILRCNLAPTALQNDTLPLNKNKAEGVSPFRFYYTFFKLLLLVVATKAKCRAVKSCTKERRVL